MMREMAKEATKRFFGQVWDDFLGYFRAYEYIKLKTAKLTGRTVQVPSVPSFWYSILGDKFSGDRTAGHLRLRDGDVLKFSDVFLTEWAPKLPGKAWTIEGLEEFAEAQRDAGSVLRVDDKFYAVLAPRAKERVVAAGYGSIRIARRARDADHFMYMSLVSKDHWHCDLGIPVVVSRQVYEEFYSRSEHGAPWVRQVEGVLHLDDDLPFEKLVPRAVGALLSPEAEATLRYRSGLPKCYVHIVSPLSINTAHNDSHPPATAWTQFETRLRSQRYRYTYMMFDPCSDDSIDAAIAFIRQYAHEYEGERLITDFDGQRPRLEALLPLTTSPLNSRKARGDILDLIAGYNRWISQEVLSLDRYR